MLKIADRIVFVDKMFEPAVDRRRILLAEFIAKSSADRSTFPIFEYHTKIDNDEFGKPHDKRVEELQKESDQFLSGIIPVGGSIKIVRWDQRRHGDFFHERCILTDKGGIRIDWGLDVGKSGETTLVLLMADDVWRQSWARFQAGATTFEFVDSVVVQGRK